MYYVCVRLLERKSKNPEFSHEARVLPGRTTNPLAACYAPCTVGSNPSAVAATKNDSSS